MRIHTWLGTALLLVAGCGMGGPTGGADMSMMATMDLSAAAGDMAFPSRCGRPGDTGNSLGVGKFCMDLGDCSGNGKATLCSSLGNDPKKPEDDSFFCTFTCTKNDPPNYCGENASCQCGGLGCACTHDRCLSPDDGGMMSDGPPSD